MRIGIVNKRNFPMGAVEVVLGPISSGKTHRVTQQYVAFVKEQGCDRALLVVPTRRKAAETRTSIVLNYRISGLLSPRIVTFEDVVQLVLGSARHTAAAISDVGRYVTLERVVSEMDRKGELSFFKDVSGFPGFVDVIGHLISELKLCEVEPERFSAALEKRGASPRDKEVGAVYARYQRELHLRNLYDTEGGYWIAAQILRESGCPELQDAALVIVDGFHTFTSAELTVVEELSHFIPRIVFTLDYDSAPERSGLFAASTRTLDIVRERFPQIIETVVETAPADRPLAVLGRELFREGRSDVRRDAPALGKIEIVEAPSELREVDEICREAKRLIVERSCSPDDIAVVFRNLDVYGPLARDAFESYGLPCRIGTAQPLSKNPVVKTILCALAIRESDWERDGVVGFAKSNYVRLDDTWSPLLPQWVERWARCARVLRTRKQWLEQLRRKRRALESQEEPTDADEFLSEEDRRTFEKRRRNAVAEIDEVLAFVQELGSVLDILPDEANTTTFVGALCQVMARLGIQGAILGADTPEVVRRDLAAYTRLVQILGEMEQVDMERRARQYGFKEFSATLRHVLDRERAPEHAGAEGKISVLDVQHARHYRFPVVFIGGMVEGVFPHQHDQDPLYNDSARRELTRHGVRLQDRGSKNVEEMFLFYAAITGATDRIYLTYPTTDAKGQPRMRSFYVDEVIALLDAAVQPRKLLYSEPVPGLSYVWNMMDVGEWLFSALWSRHDEREDMDRDRAVALYDRAVETRQELVGRALLNARVEDRRQSSDLPDEYDGVLSEPQVLDEVARRYSQEHVFSASALDDYGSCPFMYFCRRVLDLQPMEEPEEALAALDRGNLYHKILWRFYTELRDERPGAARLSKSERDLLVERMIRVAREECDRFQRTGFVGNQGLWRLARRSIERNLERFVDHEIASSEKGPRRCPAYFELCFGTKRRPPYDANSIEEPLTVDGVRLGGKIDRVDIAETDNMCVVVDYKTGRAQTSWTEVAEGRSFQLPVYWFACEELLFQDRGTQCMEACFYRLCGDYAVAESRLRRNRPDWEVSLAQCRRHIKEYADSIRSGRFPTIPPDGCPGWCEYRDICRYERGRIERKLERVGEQDAETRRGLAAMLRALKSRG